MTFRRKRALDGLDRDIRAHIDRETQDNVERGLSPEEARRQAMLACGNVALVKEDTRSIWVWVWAEQLLQDVRYACRLLRRDRVFTAVVVLTLAIAIGMNTAIFSVFNAVVLRPLAYPQPDKLVWLSTVGPEEDRGSLLDPISSSGGSKRRLSSAWSGTERWTTRWHRHKVPRAFEWRK